MFGCLRVRRGQQLRAANRRVAISQEQVRTRSGQSAGSLMRARQQILSVATTGKFSLSRRSLWVIPFT